MKINIKQNLLALLALPVLGLAVVAGVPPVANAACEPGDGLQGKPQECAKGKGQPESLTDEETGVFRIISNVLLFIIGAIAVIMLIIGGIRYTISQGDSSAVQSAKNTILYAVIGIVVAILAYAIVNFVIDSFVAEG